MMIKRGDAGLNKRQAQKLETFNELSAVARRVFFQKNYDDVSIGEIAAAAGVSRATVYLHFANKSEMLRNVLHNELQEQILVYRQLAKLPRLTRPAVRAWLIDYRKAFDARRGFWELWQSSASLEAGRAELVAEHREAAIAVLGERYPAFRYRHLSPALAERRRATAHLLLFQMEGVVNYFSTNARTPSVEVGIDLLTDRIIAFCRHTDD